MTLALSDAPANLNGSTEESASPVPAPVALPTEPTPAIDTLLGGGALRLNLGSGPLVIEGFKSVDRMYGEEVYPLAYADGSVEEVYASHVLEHFPTRESENVVKDWVRVLKPGGRIRIAVPDMQLWAQNVVAGTNFNATGYMFGGQSDENDFHKTGFDESGLRWYMEKAGLVGIQRWTSTIKDCAALPISLNLEGYKPVTPTELGRRVRVVATMPELNHTDNRDCTTLACMQLGISYACTSGAYVDQGFERALEQAKGCEYAIVIDYDSVFNAEDIERLIVLMDRHPEAGAIAAMQAQRGPEGKLLIARNEHDCVSECEAGSDIFKVKSAHFGLTAIRMSVLDKMQKPWFQHQPSPNNDWGDGRIDADVGFWHKLNAVSQAYVSPRVSIGHMQRMVTWVNGDWRPIHQHITEYRKSGKPASVRG